MVKLAVASAWSSASKKTYPLGGPRLRARSFHVQGHQKVKCSKLLFSLTIGCVAASACTGAFAEDLRQKGGQPRQGQASKTPKQPSVPEFKSLAQVCKSREYAIIKYNNLILYYENFIGTSNDAALKAAANDKIQSVRNLLGYNEGSWERMGCLELLTHYTPAPTISGR